MLVVIGTDFIGSYKSNHHMMTTLISPDTIDRHSAFNAVGNHKTKEGVKRSFLNSTHNLILTVTCII